MVTVNEDGEGERRLQVECTHSTSVLTSSILAGKRKQGKRKDTLAFLDLTLSNGLENKAARSCPFIKACSEKNTENAIL